MKFFGEPTEQAFSGTDKVYSKEKLSQFGEFVEILPEDLYMLVKIEEIDGEPFKVDFAFFSFSSEDEKGVELSLLMFGHGYSGNLRECRHTYWGEEGYIFYPQGKHFTAIFKELSKYFDEME